MVKRPVTITAYHIRSARTVDGEPMFGAVELGPPIHAWVRPPRRRQVIEPGMDGVAVDAVLELPAAAIESRRVTPSVGDRVRLRTTERTAQGFATREEAYELQSVTRVSAIRYEAELVRVLESVAGPQVDLDFDDGSGDEGGEGGAP